MSKEELENAGWRYKTYTQPELEKILNDATHKVIERIDIVIDEGQQNRDSAHTIMLRIQNEIVLIKQELTNNNETIS